MLHVSMINLQLIPDNINENQMQIDELSAEYQRPDTFYNWVFFMYIMKNISN